MTFSTILCSIITVYVLYEHDVPASSMPQLLGMWSVSLLDTAQTMLLVMILFAGPIFEYGVVEGAFMRWMKLQGVYESLSSWIGYRNFVVVCDPQSYRGVF